MKGATKPDYMSGTWWTNPTSKYGPTYIIIPECMKSALKLINKTVNGQISAAFIYVRFLKINLKYKELEIVC